MSQLNAGTVTVGLKFKPDEASARAAAIEMAKIAQQEAEIRLRGASDGVSAAANDVNAAASVVRSAAVAQEQARGAIVSASASASGLPNVAPAIAGGYQPKVMAELTRQSQFDAAKARMQGGIFAQIDSLLESSRKIGGQVGQYLETAAMRMMAGTREAFTRQAQSAARQTENRINAEKNLINRVELQGAKAQSQAALAMRNLSPEDQSWVKQRAMELRAAHGVDYRASVAAAMSDYKSDGRVFERQERDRQRTVDGYRGEFYRHVDAVQREEDQNARRYEGSLDAANLARQKAEERDIVAARNASNRLELQAEKDRASVGLRMRDLSAQEQRAVLDRARDLRAQTGVGFKESVHAALGERDDRIRDAAVATRDARRVRDAEFAASLAELTPSKQVRAIDRLIENRWPGGPNGPNGPNGPDDELDYQRLRRMRADAAQKTPLGQFLSAPSGMSLFFNAMFGGYEIGIASLAYGSASNAVGPAAQFKQYRNAADAVAGGILGSIANLFVDPFGTERARMDAVASAAEIQDARTNMTRENRDSLKLRRLQAVAGRDAPLLIGTTQARVQQEELSLSAEETGRKMDEQRDKEVASLREQQKLVNVEQRERRVQRRLGELYANAGYSIENWKDAPTALVHQLRHQAERDVELQDEKAVQDLIKQRDGERNATMKDLKATAASAPMRAALKAIDGALKRGETDRRSAAAIELSTAGFDVEAQRLVLKQRHEEERQKLEDEFAGTHVPGVGNILYTMRRAQLFRKQQAESASLEQQVTQNEAMVRRGTQAIPRSLNWTTLEERYAGVDAGLNYDETTGRFGNLAPGADGYMAAWERRERLRGRARGEEGVAARDVYRGVNDRISDANLDARAIAYERSMRDRGMGANPYVVEAMQVASAGAISVARKLREYTDMGIPGFVANLMVAQERQNVSDRLGLIRDEYVQGFRGEQYDFQNLSADAGPQADIPKTLESLDQTIAKLPQDIANAINGIVQR